MNRATKSRRFFRGSIPVNPLGEPLTRQGKIGPGPHRNDPAMKPRRNHLLHKNRECGLIILTISFPTLSKKNHAATVYNNSVVIPAYQSKILIANGAVSVPNCNCLTGYKFEN